MPVSFERGVAFVHLTKTGGRSIVRSLQNAGLTFDYIGRPFSDYLGCRTDREALLATLRRARPNDTAGVPADHLPATVLRDLCGDRWSRLFRFSVVRNPWDRMVSLYAYWKRHLAEPAHAGERGIHEDHLRRSDTFTSFVLSYPAGAPDMSASLLDEAGADLIDFTGRFEHLAADFARVCDRAGVAVPLVHINSSDRGAYSGYYTPASQAAVSRRFARDIDRFEYRF